MVGGRAVGGLSSVRCQWVAFCEMWAVVWGAKGGRLVEECAVNKCAARSAGHRPHVSRIAVMWLQELCRSAPSEGPLQPRQPRRQARAAKAGALCMGYAAAGVAHRLVVTLHPPSGHAYCCTSQSIVTALKDGVEQVLRLL
jgi:ferric-dicitrate binding protein FerR (iron transport regulator)